MGSFGSPQVLTGYAETDPNSRIAVTAARVTGTLLACNESAWLCKDMGANWFSANFKHHLDIRPTGGVFDGFVQFWALANDVNDARWNSLHGHELCIGIEKSSGGYNLYLGEYAGSGLEYYGGPYAISVDTTYYLEVERNEAIGTYGTLYCRVYPTAADRAAGTNVLTTLSLALHAKLDYRYLYAIQTYNSGSGTVSGYTENLDVGEMWRISGRGQHAVLSARAVAGRGAHMAIYAQRRLAGRGAHCVYNSWAAAGRGLQAVTVVYAYSGRGIHAVIQSFAAAGRGRHLARNTFAVSGRGKHARCIALTAEGQGRHRAANNALARYELYRGVDAAPDFTAAPWETFASLPHATAALDPAPSGTERVYHFVLRARNAWNLATRNVEEWTVTVDDDGAVVATRPSAPEEIAVAAAAGGKVLVTARYMALEDGADAATQWLVYLRSNGTNPDPAIDTPTVVAMVKADGNVRLSWTSGVFVDGADVRAIIRARRVDTIDPGPPPVTTNVDSTNVDVHSATADTDGPAQVAPAGIFFGTLHEQAQ